MVVQRRLIREKKSKQTWAIKKDWELMRDYNNDRAAVDETDDGK